MAASSEAAVSEEAVDVVACQEGETWRDGIGRKTNPSMHVTHSNNNSTESNVATDMVLGMLAESQRWFFCRSFGSHIFHR